MKLFVYGTLKRNCRNHRVLQGEFLGEVRTSPLYKMVDFGAYPGLVHTPAGQGKSIVGELWEVMESTLRNLDIFEGVPNGMYERTNVTLENGEIAQTYFATDKLISWKNYPDYPGDCWADRTDSDLQKKKADLTKESSDLNG